MTEIKIMLDESAIRQYAEETIAKNIVSQYTAEYRDAKFGIRKAVERGGKGTGIQPQGRNHRKVHSTGFS